MKKSKRLSENIWRNENKSTTFQNPCDTEKGSSKREAIKVYLKKEEKSQINNVSYCLKWSNNKAQSQQKKRNNKDQRRNE